MITLDEQGKYNKWDHVQSEIKFTDKVLRSRIRESLEVASTYTLYCAGDSSDTNWSELISDLINNDYSALSFATDGAGDEWLPVIYLPLGCIISSNINGTYKIQSGNSNRQLERSIGQYWTVEAHPWIDTTQSIPHDPVITLATANHEVVLGQSYMSDGNYTRARINQFEPSGIDGKGKQIKVANSLMEETRDTTPMRSPMVISSEPRSIQEATTIINNETRRLMDSPSILAHNNSRSHPGSVCRISTGVEGFKHAGLDSPGAQHPPIVEKCVAVVISYRVLLAVSDWYQLYQSILV